MTSFADYAACHPSVGAAIVVQKSVSCKEITLNTTNLSCSCTAFVLSSYHCLFIVYRTIILLGSSSRSVQCLLLKARVQNESGEDNPNSIQRGALTATNPLRLSNSPPAPSGWELLVLR